MKKILSLLAVVVLLVSAVCLFASCEDHQHMLDLVEAQDPTCTESGLKQHYVCTICDRRFEDAECKIELDEYDILVRLTGHEWDNPSCTEAKICKNCGETRDASLGHEWVNATCTAPKTCKTCGETEGEAWGHAWADATCTTPKTCRACNTTEGEKLGHKELAAVKENEVLPTCTVAGSYDMVVYCSVCNGELDRDAVTVDALGHTEVIDDAVDATCTETGLTEGKHCGVCDEVLTAQEEVPALGHDFNENSACNNCGLVCYHNETEVIEAKDPTCDEVGLTEGKKCASCGYVTLAQEEIPANGHSYAYVAEGALVYGVADDSRQGLTVTGTCSVCSETTIVTDYEVDYVNGKVSVDETTLSVSVSLKYVGGEYTLAGGTYAGITLEGTTLTINDGDVTVNGSISASDSFILVDNNATVTVNGGSVTVAGAFVEDSSAEYTYKHRLFVRQGTLNIDCDNGTEGALNSNSIQVGSEKDNVKGYLNIEVGTGNGMQRYDTNKSRWIFANGAVNVIGDEVDGAPKGGVAINFVGTGYRYVDIFHNMKLTFKNMNDGIYSQDDRLYIGLWSGAVVTENSPNAIRAAWKIRIYSQEVVVAPYTDADGNTSMAYVRLYGDKIITELTAPNAHPDLTFIDFPTAETYDAWTKDKQFIGWAPHTHDYEYGIEGTVTYNSADGSYDASGLSVGTICKECGAVGTSDEYTVDVSNVFSTGAVVVKDETTIPVETKLNLVGGEHTITGGKFTDIAIDGTVLNINGNITISGAITANAGKINILGGNVTVGSTIVTTDSFFTVTGGAVLTVNDHVTINGASVANANSEYGYDYRFAVINGTVNVNCSFEGGAIEANSIVVGSVENKTEGILNLKNTAAKGNGLDNIGAFRWMFANGEVNCVGGETLDGTGICMGNSGTGYVDFLGQMKISLKNYAYGVGSWKATRYVGIYKETEFKFENVGVQFHGSTTTNRFYAHSYVEMEYTHEGKTGLAIVDVENNYVSFTGDHNSLDFVGFPTAESYGKVTRFVRWVEE